MRCEQARPLFDAYLDGELSPALATELGAHRVRCSECRRALALMQVSGHVIKSDPEEATVQEGFTDRLLACMDEPEPRWTYRFRRAIYVGAPLAAAAVIAMAFLGVFDRGETRVAGELVLGPEPVPAPTEQVTPEPESPQSPADEVAARRLEEWLKTTQHNVDTKQKSVQSLQESLDLTITQWLDILNSRKTGPEGETHYPGSEELAKPNGEKPASEESDDVEDL